MSALDRVPDNKNFLSPKSFLVQVKKLPNVIFFLQRVNLPELSIPNADYPNPFVNIPVHGDHIDYGVLDMTFKVDEDMKNYLELHNWMRGIGFPSDHSEHKALIDKGKSEGPGEGPYSDISLLIGTNLKNMNLEVVYHDAHPIYLGGMEFETTESDVEYITCQARFKFTLFEIGSLLS